MINPQLQVINAIKEAIEESIESLEGTASPVVNTEWRGDDLLRAEVDAIQDFDIRVKERREPAMHMPNQPLPPPPTQRKPQQRVRSYIRKTKNGKQRVSGYTTQQTRPDRREAMEELQDWSYDMVVREEADKEVNEAVKGGIRSGLGQFK